MLKYDSESDSELHPSRRSLIRVEIWIQTWSLSPDHSSLDGMSHSNGLDIMCKFALVCDRHLDSYSDSDSDCALELFLYHDHRRGSNVGDMI